MAYQLNQPLCPLAGALELPPAPISCEDSGIVLETLKMAEQEDAVILRLYEHYGQEREIHIGWRLPVSAVSRCDVLEQETKALVRLEGQDISLRIKPCEIVTLKIML